MSSPKRPTKQPAPQPAELAAIEQPREQPTAQPAAAPPSPEPKDVAARAIVVRCKRPAGIWRGGRFWPAEQVKVSLDAFTDEQIERIAAEPLLDVFFVAGGPDQ